MSKNILLVNRRMPRHDHFAGTLSRAGFVVQVDESYNYSPGTYFSGNPPDLVILCCEDITDQELALIAEILTHDCFLIILCATLPLSNSRFLLLANPDNLRGKSLDPDRLIELIEEVFLSMYGKSAFRESHHLGSGLGLIQFYVNNVREILRREGIVNTELDKELDKVIEDVGRVLSRSKGLQKQATEYEGEGRTQTREALISVDALLEQSKWVLPTPPANINLIYELENGLAKISVTAGQIIEILRNLVENAIEAMIDRGGEITIRAFTAYPDVRIEVIDNGPGIPEEHKSKIFNLFFSTKGGAGFGLWEAGKFARNNHGSLTLNSQLGRGSTFTLALPVFVEGGTYD